MSACRFPDVRLELTQYTKLGPSSEWNLAIWRCRRTWSEVGILVVMQTLAPPPATTSEIGGARVDEQRGAELAVLGRLFRSIRRRRRPPTTTSSCILCQFNEASMNRILIQSRRFYARFDNYPATQGHIEIVPKRHVVSLFDLTPSEARQAHRLMRRAQDLLRRQYDPDGFTVGVNDGRAAGRSIDHLHIHVIPRYEGDVEDPRGGIRQILPNCDPAAWLSAD